MLLRNFDFAIKYFDYKSKTEFEDISNSKINGWYKFVNGLISGLFVIDNNLFFLYGKDKILIIDSHRVLLKKSNKIRSEFNLINDNDVLVKFQLNQLDCDYNISPFEYIDEEDFKWHEFISRIINDSERKKNFITNLMDNG